MKVELIFFKYQKNYFWYVWLYVIINKKTKRILETLNLN